MKKRVVVHDEMQDGYAYDITEKAGENFDPEFKPDLSPREMLELGVFGGNYLQDCTDEFPNDWFANAKLQKKGIDKSDPNLNFFKINASQPLKIWQEKGWIHKDDPRGWFQWYCRYYLGRRLPDEDKRQVKRWKAINRHVSQIVNNCRKGDFSCHRRQRQAVLHWAYDSRNF